MRDGRNEIVVTVGPAHTLLCPIGTEQDPDVRCWTHSGGNLDLAGR